MSVRSVSIDYDLAVPMRDGVTLRADVYRPGGDGPFPVLVARTPYDKSDSAELVFYDPLAAVRRGFLVVVQDVRGRFASEGEWSPLVNEARDGADTIEWAARLPASSGRVGMWGLSYLGSTQWLAASEHPAALRAIAPRFTWRDPEDGYTGRGGAAEHGLMTSWSLLCGLDVVMRRHADDESALFDGLTTLVADIDDLGRRTWPEQPQTDPPIYRRNGLPPLVGNSSDAVSGRQAGVVTAGDDANPTVPSLNIAGWFDIFVQGTLDNYMAVAADTSSRLVVGPWSHDFTTARQGDVDFGFAANGFAIDLQGSLNDLTFGWLADQLGRDPGPDRAAAPADATPTPRWSPTTAERPVLLFVMGANEWRNEAQWPPARAVDTAYYFADGGMLTPAAPTDAAELGYHYDPKRPVPTLGGSTYLLDSTPGMLDQATIEERDDVLVFTSAPLAEDVEVTGRVRAELTVSTDAPSADWVVRLCHVDHDGVSRNVTDGITRVTRDAGGRYDLSVDMWSTSMLFRAGHRLRVQVTSSCFPRWDTNPNTPTGTTVDEMRTATQTVHVGAVDLSRIVLPIIATSEPR